MKVTAQEILNKQANGMWVAVVQTIGSEPTILASSSKDGALKLLYDHFNGEFPVEGTPQKLGFEEFVSQYEAGNIWFGEMSVDVFLQNVQVQ